MSTTHTAAVTKVEAINGVWSIRVRCPHCGQSHLHGGGPTTGDPTEHFGDRAADCLQGGYTLAWTTEPTA